jgi:hypothetical protein
MQLREAAYLRGDDRIGAGLVQVAPGHPGPLVPGGHDPNHAVVVFDVPVRRVGLRVSAELLVEGREPQRRYPRLWACLGHDA